MKSSEPLNGEDIEKFMNSVDVIIADMQPTRNVVVDTPAPSVDETSNDLSAIPSAGEQKRRPMSEADPNSPFAPLHGMKSTWQVQNIDNMTTEEYYAEIYRRNREMKDLRMREEGYSRESAQDYLSSINKLNRSK